MDDIPLSLIKLSDGLFFIPLSTNRPSGLITPTGLFPAAPVLVSAH